MSETWKLNPANGDYIMEGGKPVPTERLHEAAYYRLRIKRTQWMYAPDTDYGSDFYLQQKNRTTGDQSQLETIAARAIQPLVDDQRASDIEVEAVVVKRNGVGIQLTITDNQGEQEKVVINPIVT